MDIEKLIEQLNARGLGNGSSLGYHCGLFDDAATALSTLQAENAEMQKQLNEFSEFLCHMTGGLLSKTNYTAQEMISAAEDYQQDVCGECDLRAENEMPAADVAEVRHGRWIPEACASVSKRNRLIEYRVYSCSICGRSNGRVKKRYCPNCGALMDKEGEHEVSES